MIYLKWWVKFCKIEYYDHYQEYLSRAIDREIFECNKDLPQIQILKYEKVFKDCIVYSTIGLTKYNEVLNNVLEVTMVSDSAFDDISSILANVLFFLYTKWYTDNKEFYH